MKKNSPIIILFSAALLLAALGCLFLWNFPMEWMWGENQHHLFERQLQSNIAGIVLFAGAWALGWKRWLKAAPWLAMVWFALLVAALMGRPVNGAYRWVSLGVVRFNVQTWFWPLVALFVAWLCSHQRIKPWMVYAFVGFVIAFFLLRVFASPNRMARLLAFFVGADTNDMRLYMQHQARTAIEVAEWIGHSGRSLRYLPHPHTDSAVAGVALVLGKLAVACAVALMGVIASCLASFWRQATDPARRTYVLGFGIIILMTAGWNFLQSLMLVPACGCTFSLLGYGGTDVICAWAGLGIAVAAAGECDASQVTEKRWWLPWMIGLSVAAVLISAMSWAPIRYGARFCEPMPKASELGEFGTESVRGTIYAADGTTLATSVGVWQVHVDPQAVRYSAIMGTNEVVEAVSKGLGLTHEETRAIYEKKKSRYVLARQQVEGEMLKWCQVGRNARCYGLVLEKVQRRSYPFGVDATHVTGCCSYGGWDRDPLSGAAGLEQACDKVLKGVNGKVDEEHALAENLRTGVPTNGGAVKTTIEVPIQRAMSNILRESVASNHAESAWAMAVRIPSGKIMAMSSYPTFDPNTLDRSVAYTAAMKNGAVQTLHEPGGLIKPIVYALAVDAGCVKPGEINGWDNATFTNLCHVIGTNQMWQGFQKFGFGQKSGEGTFSGEEIGIVHCHKRWIFGMLECFGIGRGLSVTGLQLAQAYATLANGGVRIKPYVVESMTDAAGKVVWSHKVQQEQHIVSAESAAAVTKLMLSETNVVVRVAGITVAGKTSTFALVKDRQKNTIGYSTKDFDSMYAGFFPADKPEYAVVVAFRKPHPEHASEQVALPAFEKIAKALLQVKGRD